MSCFKEFWKESVAQDEENKRLLLQEGLVTSYPYPILQRQLQKHSSVRDVRKIDDEFGITHSFEVHIITRISEEEKKAIRNTINLCGYFVSCENKYNIGPGAEILEYLVEPKFPVLLTNAKMPEYGYHVSPKIFSERIQTIGLTPKASKRPQFQYDGNRIYVLLSEEPEYDTSILIRALHSNSLRNDKSGKYQKRTLGASDYEIFKVNMRSLTFHDFYYDPRLPYKSLSSSSAGVFTLKNIKPQYIEKISFSKENQLIPYDDF